MKHEQLTTLAAIVSTGTFRGAADALNKSQSAVSHAIRLLEDEIGFALFSRSAYRPTLTREGEVFFREASHVLHQMRELKGTAARLRASEEPELSVAITNTLPLSRFLDAIADVGRQFPATHIRLTTESMGGPVARLMAGDADIAIATVDGVVLGDVEAHPLTERSIRPVAHPALAKELGDGVASLAEMQGRIQVVVAGTGGPPFEQSRDVLPGGRRWTVSDFQAKKQVILAGLGWGGLPDHLTEDDRKASRLVAINVEGYPPRHATLHAIRRREAAVGRVGNALWSRLQLAAKSN